MIVGALLLAGFATWVLVREPKTLAPPPISESTFERFQIGGIPRSVLTTPDAVWVARGDRSVLKLDPSDGSRIAKTRLSFLPAQMVSAGGAVWVGAIEGTTIARLDPDTAKVVSEVEVGTTPQSLATDETNLYVAAFDDGVVERLDPDTGEVLEEVFGGRESFPSAVLPAYGSLWVSDVVVDTVTRVPAPSGERSEVTVGDSPTRLVAGRGAVWVANFNARSVSRIDPEVDDPPTEILVGGKPGAMVFAEGYVWVLRPGSDSLVAIDTAAGRWTGHVYEVAAAPQDIAAGHGSLWIVSQEGTITRVPIE